MAKKKKKKFAWIATFFSTDIKLVEVTGMKLYRNGYVNYFETKEDAVEYKRRQLDRIVRQYRAIGQQMPLRYSNQITEMEKEYGKRKKIS